MGSAFSGNGFGVESAREKAKQQFPTWVWRLDTESLEAVGKKIVYLENKAT